MTELFFVVATVCTQKRGKQREGATHAETCRCASLTLNFTVDHLSLETSTSTDCTQCPFRTYMVTVGSEDHTVASSCDICYAK
jgi:hypothetical protein